MADQIGKVRVNQSDIERRGKEAVARLSSLKSNLVGLGDIKEAVTGLDSQIKSAKEELRAACTRFR